MGSSASVHTIEVSMIDQNTGEMLSDDQINALNEKALDISNKIYDAYKDPIKLKLWAESLGYTYTGNKVTDLSNNIKIN